MTGMTTVMKEVCPRLEVLIISWAHAADAASFQKAAVPTAQAANSATSHTISDVQQRPGQSTQRDEPSVSCRTSASPVQLLKEQAQILIILMNGM
jgi:hypothetical protein